MITAMLQTQYCLRHFFTLSLVKKTDWKLRYNVCPLANTMNLNEKSLGLNTFSLEPKRKKFLQMNIFKLKSPVDYQTKGNLEYRMLKLSIGECHRTSNGKMLEEDIFNTCAEGYILLNKVDIEIVLTVYQSFSKLRNSEEETGSSHR